MPQQCSHLDLDDELPLPLLAETPEADASVMVTIDYKIQKTRAPSS